MEREMSTQEIRHAGLRRARSMGHRVSGWTPDVDDGYLAECDACSLFMACIDPRQADPGEPPVWGVLLRQRCSGRRMA